MLCFQENGDWRYNPGDLAHDQYLRRADELMRYAASHIDPREPSQGEVGPLGMRAPWWGRLGVGMSLTALCEGIL